MGDVIEARWLDIDATARYLSVRADALPRLVKQGRIPEPNYLLGPRMPRWDRDALDAAFDAGAESTNTRSAVHALAQKLATQSRSGRQA